MRDRVREELRSAIHERISALQDEIKHWERELERLAAMPDADVSDTVPEWEDSVRRATSY